MSKFNSCRWCGDRSDAMEIVGAYSAEVEWPFAVHCTSCGAKGPTGSTPEEATEKWNAPTLTPERVDELWDQAVKEHPIQLHGFHFYQAIKQELEES